MDAYEILRDVHRIGSRISGVVLSRDAPALLHGVIRGGLQLATHSAYPALLAYDYLVDQGADSSPDIIPDIGAPIDAVVRNFAGGTLHLSARPSDVAGSTVLKWQEYYDYIATLPLGSTITGIVERAMPFGLFVETGGPYSGLIDIGHISFNGGTELPSDPANWPAVGNRIRCHVGYYRLHNRQIGLGWSPKNAARSVQIPYETRFAKMSVSWFELWGDPSLTPPYVLILMAYEGVIPRYEVIDPQDGRNCIFYTSDYKEATFWLAEDEYERFSERIYDG